MGNVGIYKITSPTGKVYIGQSLNMGGRFSHYRCLDKAIKKQRKLYSSLFKYGLNNHTVEVVHELPKDVSREVLNNYEILYMEAHKDCGVELLNIKEGGLNGRHSEETKEKQRLNGKLGKPVSEETREKMRIARLGKKSTRINYKHSEEVKLKMRKPHKINPNQTYHPISEEHKLKMKEARGKLPHPFLGKHHSQESKDKVSKSKKGCNGTRNKKVICQKTGIIYNSAKEAALAIGVKHSTLIARLSGPNNNNTTLKYL